MLLWWRDFLSFLFPMAEKIIYIYKDGGRWGREERRDLIDESQRPGGGALTAGWWPRGDTDVLLRTLGRGCTLLPRGCATSWGAGLPPQVLSCFFPSFPSVGRVGDGCQQWRHRGRSRAVLGSRALWLVPSAEQLP